MEKLKLIKCWKTLLLLISMSLFSEAVFAQNVPLRGKIIDETGQPLVGASVRVTGTTNGVTADISGNFVLNVPANATSITISFIGYIDLVEKIATGTKNLGTVRLAQNAKSLTEVVVVGYGSLRKQDVTGTSVSVDNKSLQEVPSANVFEQLKGKVAGLDVVSGNNGPAITIRGNRTIGNPAADGPLIVLDGEPYYNFIENINPNDIKSIDVLKGASATAIYGTRGSGGVLLISTFRGRVGQTVTSYDSYYSMSRLEGQLKVLNGTQYAQLKQDAIQGSILQNTGSAPLYALTPAETAALAAGVSTNWVNLLEKPAMTWDQSLRVSSGTDRTQINVGASYRTQTGLEPNLKSNRIALTASVDHQINKFIKFGVSMDATLRNSDNGGGNQIGGAQGLTPLASPYNADGSINVLPWVGATDNLTLSPLVPGSIPTSYYNHTRGFVSNNIIYAEISPIEHLKYRYTVNYNFSQSLQGQYNGINGGGIQTILATNASTTNNYSYRLNQEHLLTYDNAFGKHHINIVAGFNAEKAHSDNSSISATNIPQDAAVNSNLSLGTFQSDAGSYSETGLLSYFARVNYAFDNKYDVTATIRTDGNSVLAAGHQYTSYPSIGLGWVISNEKFMKKYAFIDNLKLRGGYGKTSNNGGVLPYQTLGPLNSVKYQYGGISSGDASGVRVTNLVNNNLTWQTTAEYNLALDFAVLKSRITGSIEVYKQTTTGIILPNALPATTGASSQISNLGSSANRGLEITLSSINIQNLHGFSWSTDFNIAFAREQITGLPNGIQVIPSAGEFVGSPLSVIYDLKKIGIWQLGDSPGVSAAGVAQPVRGQTSPLQYPGQIHVQDVNGDGKIDANDNQIIGHFNPNYTFGFTNRFNYKNFDLNIVIQARMGFTTTVPYVSSANSGTQGFQFLNLGRHNQPVLDYWTPTNPTNAFPEPNDQFQSQYYSTLQYYDGSFIRAKSINLGYNIPGSVLKHAGISSLRVYANVTNPFIIYAPVMHHSFSVTDPESISGGGQFGVNPVSAGSSGNIGGYDANQNANGFRGVYINAGEQTRDFLIGINARF